MLGPGVYGPMLEEGATKGAPQMERMSTDIHSLKLQYERLKERQRQAHIIIAGEVLFCACNVVLVQIYLFPSL